MKLKLKNLLVISALQLIFGVTFAQIIDTVGPVLKDISKSEMDSILKKKSELGELVYDLVDEPAEFLGGTQALRKFLFDNIKYPERALKDSIEGRCSVKLLISEMGEVKKAQISRGIEDCPECDTEAMRIMYLMPKWKPAKVNEKNVSSYYRIPVTFKL